MADETTQDVPDVEEEEEEPDTTEDGPWRGVAEPNTTEDVPNVEEPDTTESDLRSWGLSGQPATWALSTWTEVINIIRAGNRGDMDANAVQQALDATFPDGGYQAANVMLAHPPVGEFTATATDLNVRVDLAGDEDLGLSDDMCEWDFGDGSPLIRDAGGWDHEYATDGIYPVRLVVTAAGARYGSGQNVSVGAVPKDAPVVGAGDTNPGVLARDATTFESETDDKPNTSVSPEESAAQAEAVAMYTSNTNTWAGPDNQTGVEQEPPDVEEQTPDTGTPRQVSDPEAEKLPPEEVSADAGEAEETSRTEDYDPSEHTVAEVLAYIDEHPDEADAIYDAEKAGKGRVGILGG